MKKFLLFVSILSLVAGCGKFPIFEPPLTKVNKAFPNGNVKHLPVENNNDVWLVKQPDGSIYLVSTYSGFATNIIFPSDHQ